jgi:flagellar motor switch protein FliG
MHGIDRVRKAAILLLSLPEGHAVDLLARLEPRQASRVIGEIAKNQAVSQREQHQVILEFAGVDPLSIEAPRGGKHVARQLLLKARQAPQGTLASLRRLSSPRPLEFLRNVDTRRLVALLADEHPQTIAVVANRLPPARAAAMLTLLPAPLRETVIGRVMAVEPVDIAVMRELAHVLRWRLLAGSERALRVDAALSPPLPPLLSGPHFSSPATQPV